VEANAIKTIFRDYAASGDLALSSTKVAPHSVQLPNYLYSLHFPLYADARLSQGAIGHLLGAAGSVEAIFTVLAIHHVRHLLLAIISSIREKKLLGLTSSAVFRESPRLRSTWSSRTHCLKARSRHYLQQGRCRYERPSPTPSGSVEPTPRCCSRPRPSRNSTALFFA
jgi:hypothetical protein